MRPSKDIKEKSVIKGLNKGFTYCSLRVYYTRIYSYTWLCIRVVVIVCLVVERERDHGGGNTILLRFELKVEPEKIEKK